MHKINFKKIDERAVIPFKAHSTDVGYDIIATSCEYDENKDVYIYHTGLICETYNDKGETNVCNIYPRSSNSRTEGYLTNSVGTIDSDGYRGEIQARWKNRTSLETMIQLEALRQFCVGYKKSYLEIEKEVRADYVSRAHNLEFAPYKPGEKIMQMVLYSIPSYEVNEVDEVDMNTERGEGGYGSSGK